MTTYISKTLNSVLSAATETRNFKIIRNDRAKSTSTSAYNYLRCICTAWAFALLIFG